MTESDIELMAIEQLEGMGYTYVYGPEIESKGNNPLRSFDILPDLKDGDSSCETLMSERKNIQC